MRSSSHTRTHSLPFNSSLPFPSPLQVHCISKADGAIWERLLVATPAPFIALSATIGNPLEFGGWLKDLERAKGRNLEVIEVDMRINDLALHIYDSRKIKRQREADRAVPLNPLGILSVRFFALCVVFALIGQECPWTAVACVVLL